MKLSLDKYDVNTAYADLGSNEQLERCVDKAVSYALENGRDYVEIYQNKGRVATYQFDGTRLK